MIEKLIEILTTNLTTLITANRISQALGHIGLLIDICDSDRLTLEFSTQIFTTLLEKIKLMANDKMVDFERLQLFLDRIGESAKEKKIIELHNEIMVQLKELEGRTPTTQEIKIEQANKIVNTETEKKTKKKKLIDQLHDEVTSQLKKLERYTASTHEVEVEQGQTTVDAQTESNQSTSIDPIQTAWVDTNKLLTKIMSLTHEQENMSVDKRLSLLKFKLPLLNLMNALLVNAIQENQYTKAYGYIDKLIKQYHIFEGMEIFYCFCAEAIETISQLVESNYSFPDMTTIITLLEQTDSIVSTLENKKHRNESVYYIERAIVIAEKFELTMFIMKLSGLQGTLLMGGSKKDSALTLDPFKTVFVSINNFCNGLRLAEKTKNESEIKFNISKLNEICKCHFYGTKLSVLEKKVLTINTTPLFESYWNEVKSFSEMLSVAGFHNEAWGFITKFYKNAGNTFNSDAWFPEFLLFLCELSNTILLDKETFSEPTHIPSWTAFKNKLRAHRAEFTGPNLLKQPVLERQRKFTENMLGLVAEMITACQAWLGPAPDLYCFAAAGSASHGNMMPRSDLEGGLLFRSQESAEWEESDSFKTNYFDQMNLLFELLMACLGEFNPAGFHLDEQGQPRKEVRLRGTASHWIRFSKPPHVTSIADNLTHSLLFVEYVCGNDNKVLFSEYRDLLEDNLSKPLKPTADLPWLQSFILAMRKISYVKAFNQTDLRVLDKADSIDIKSSFNNPLNLLIYDLALTYGLHEKNPELIVKTLIDKDYLCQSFGELMIKSLQIIQSIRIAIHDHHSEQCEEIGFGTAASKKNQLLLAGDNEKKVLSMIAWGVILPAYLSIENYKIPDIDSNNGPFDPIQNMINLYFSNKATLPTYLDEEGLMKSIFSSLRLHNASTDDYNKVFLRLPQQLRKKLHSKVKNLMNKSSWKKLHSIEKRLQDCPLPNGKKMSLEILSDKFNRDLLLLTQIYSPGQQVNKPNIRFVYYDSNLNLVGHNLAIELVKQWFLDSGEIDFTNKRITRYGKRMVLPLSIKGEIVFYAKIYPELPGYQLMADSLIALISGSAGKTLLTRFFKRSTTTEQKYIYPVLLSHAVKGYNLQDLLSNKLQTLTLETIISKLDPYYYSLRIFETLLICPEDDKPDNLIAQPLTDEGNNSKFRIVSIDSDHAFIEPITFEKQKMHTRIKLNLKSIILCMDKMLEPINSTAKMTFLSLDCDEILKNWLTKLNDRAYLEVGKQKSKKPALFTWNETRACIKNKNHSSFLPIAFNNSLVKGIVKRWLRLRAALVNDEQASLTHFDFLRVSFHPQLKFIAKYFTNIQLLQNDLINYQLIMSL